MLTQYYIAVHETVSSRDGLRSHTCKKQYVKELRDDYLNMDSIPSKSFDTFEDAENFIEQLPVQRCGEYINKYTYNVEAIEHTHANFSGYSDVHPYEIVKVVSPKTIEVRLVDAELDPAWKPEVIAGGFAGHTVNNGSQKWIYKSNQNNRPIRLRKRKDGYFYSAGGRHVLSNAPEKFYDYNF